MAAQHLGKGKEPKAVPRPPWALAQGTTGPQGSEGQGDFLEEAWLPLGLKRKASQAGKTTETEVWSLDMSHHASSCPYLISMH